MSDETILQEAQRLVHGPRQTSYGHPFDDFTRTGRMWGAILGTEGPIPPDLVALCLIAVKVSREVNAPKRDNIVDIAGYAETLSLVRERQDDAEIVICPECCREIAQDMAIHVCSRAR